jgi:hypothetical protein
VTFGTPAQLGLDDTLFDMSVISRVRLASVLVACLVPGPAVMAQHAVVDPCARKEASLLLPLVGAWSVTWTNRTEPGKYETVQATSQFARDQVGCILTERFTGRARELPYQALSVINFGHAEALERIALDSLHGQFLFFTGSAYDRGVRFEWVSPKNNGRLRLRHEYRSLQPDTFQTQTDLSTDGGATWVKVNAADYRRSE